jgi:hypothetical protein
VEVEQAIRNVQAMEVLAEAAAVLQKFPMVVMVAKVD